jgi:hypothetical protein
MTFRKFFPRFLLCWLITIIPLWFLHGVIGVDTPNHVARAYLLASIPNDSGQLFYESHWSLIPNLGMDIIFYPFLYLTPIDPVLLMKVFMSLTFFITGFGYAWLNRQWNGDWTEWGMSGLLFSFSFVLGFGFVNYLFGIGLALLLLGAALHFRNSKWSLNVILAIGMPILLISHLVAFGLFTIAIGAIWLFEGDKKKLGSIGYIFGICFAVFILIQSPTTHAKSTLIYVDPIKHFQTILSPLFIGNLWRDLIFQCLIISTSAILIYRKKLAWNTTAQKLFVFFLVICLIAPHQALTSAFISSRLPLWLLLIGGATIKSVRSPYWIIALLLLGRSGDMASRFLSYNPKLDQLQSDFSKIEDNSLMYQVAHSETLPLAPPGWNPSMLHQNCLILLSKHLYVNNLFTIPAQQPLILSGRTGKDLRDLYTNEEIFYALKVESDKIKQHIAQIPDERIRQFPAYIYFLKPKGAVARTDVLEVIADREDYTLYRIQ